MRKIKDACIWVWVKVKQLLTWMVSKFINVCRCDK